MAGGNQQLNFAIRAVNEASKALADVGADIDTVGKKSREAEGHTSRFGGALGNVATVAAGFALGGGLMAAPGQLFDMAKAAAEDEAANQRLNQTLHNLAEAAQQATGVDIVDYMASWTDAVNGAIDAGAELGFTDDDIRDSFQFLATATGSSAEAMNRMGAAQDLARGAGIPLAQATKMLGKLNEENIQVFKKLGITLDDTASETDALAAVQAKFGGQAATYAQSSAGQFEVMQIKISEAKESIGYALLPVMAQLTDLLSVTLVPAIQLMADGLNLAGEAVAFVQSHIDVVGPILAGIAAGILAALLPALYASIPGWYASAAAAATAAVAFIAANLPLIAIAAAIALVVAGIALLITHWDDIVDKVPLLGAAFDAAMAVIKGAFSAVTTAAEAVIGFMRDHWPEVVTLLAGPFAPIVAVATDAFGIRTALIGGFQAVLDWLTSTWTTVSSAVTSAFQAAIDWVTNNWPIIATLISGPFAPIVLLATDAFGVRSALVSAFHAVWDAITGTIGTLGAFIINLVPDVIAAARSLGSAIVDGISQGVTGLVNIGEDLGIVIANGVIDAINFVIDKVNRALEFDVDLWVKTIHIDPPDIPHVPHLAAGGIVTRPTLAMIGEGGYPEAVVPLAGPNAPSGLGGNTYNLHFHGFVGDVDALIVEMERRRVFA